MSAAGHAAEGASRHPRVLLVINIPEPDAATRAEIESERLPRRDFYELQRELDADLLFLDAAGRSLIGWLARRAFGRRVGPRIALAIKALRMRRDYDIVFTDTEAVGLPFAFLLKLVGSRASSPRHVTLAHNLASMRNNRAALVKRLLFRFGIASHVDTMIVHSSAQLHLAVERFGVRPERVVRLPYQVDTRFWQPTPEGSQDAIDRDIIVVPGHECRDYPTLLAAIRDLPVEAEITTRAVTDEQRQMATHPDWPQNLQFHAYDFEALRRLYARARLVIVPLLPVDFQAGITAILEAMAMGRPVIVSGIRGQTDVICDPRGDIRRPAEASGWPTFIDEGGAALNLGSPPTGWYVRPSDADDLRDAITALLSDRDQAEALGRNGRTVAASLFSIEDFARRFASAILGESENGSRDQPRADPSARPQRAAHAG